MAGAPPLMLALKRLQIVGSVVGTLKDVEEALDFTARGLVHVGATVAFEDTADAQISQYLPQVLFRIWMSSARE